MTWRNFITTLVVVLLLVGLLVSLGDLVSASRKSRNSSALSTSSNLGLGTWYLVFEVYPGSRNWLPSSPMSMGWIDPFVGCGQSNASSVLPVFGPVDFILVPWCLGACAHPAVLTVAVGWLLFPACGNLLGFFQSGRPQLHCM